MQEIKNGQGCAQHQRLALAVFYVRGRFFTVSTPLYGRENFLQASIPVHSIKVEHGKKLGEKMQKIIYGSGGLWFGTNIGFIPSFKASFKSM